MWHPNKSNCDYKYGVLAVPETSRLKRGLLGWLPDWNLAQFIFTTDKTVPNRKRNDWSVHAMSKVGRVHPKSVFGHCWLEWKVWEKFLKLKFLPFVNIPSISCSPNHTGARQLGHRGQIMFFRFSFSFSFLFPHNKFLLFRSAPFMNNGSNTHIHRSTYICYAKFA